MFGAASTFGANKPFGGTGFGSTATTTPAGGFGASTTFGSSGASTGFGTTFGSPPATSGASGIGTGAFGTSSPGIKSFGAATAGQSTGFGTGTGFGSFGSVSGASTAQPASGFGSTGFGSTTQASTGTTGFGTGFGGGTTAPSFGSSSGFGTSTTTPSFGSATGGGFGSTTSTLGFGSSGGFGGFGSSAVDSSKSTFGGLGFGSTATTPATAPTDFSKIGFGSTGGGFSSTSSFGSLGSSTVFGGLGSSSTGGFGQPSAWSSTAGTFAAPQQQQQMLVSNPVVQAFEKLQSYYASSRDWQSGKYLATSEGKPNEDCEFKSIMYNRRVDSSTPTETLWRSRQFELAEQDNTDPENLVPVLELGMAPLKKRFENQVTEAAKSEQHIKALNDVLSTVEMANTQVAVRFEALRMRQVDIYRTLLTLMRKMEVLRCHGQRLQPQEVRYRDRLISLLHRTREAQQQLQKLSSSVTMLQQEKRQREVYSEVQDPDDMEFLCHALQKQREGLEYVTEMLKKDMRDVKIIHSLMQKEGSAGSNNLHSERKYEPIL
mmetsp:Transcript_27607/g.39189  ORF Transcript_27607/g.39189 Transcript_27607/m.39189 type:complete len:546 (+) Transcript_27607:13-1650(+)